MRVIIASLFLVFCTLSCFAQSGRQQSLPTPLISVRAEPKIDFKPVIYKTSTPQTRKESSILRRLVVIDLTPDNFPQSMTLTTWQYSLGQFKYTQAVYRRPRAISLRFNLPNIFHRH